jgi:hypothetical protein
LESVVISEEERKNESTNHPDNCHDNKNSDDLKQEQNGNSTISNEMDTTITSLPKNSVLRSNLPKKHSGDDDNASGSTTVDGRKKAAWNVYLKIQDFARSGQLERATELLESLQQHDSQAVGMGAQHILQGYSRRLMVDSLRSRRDDAVHAAEQLVQKLEERGVLDDVSHSKWCTEGSWSHSIHDTHISHSTILILYLSDGRKIASNNVENILMDQKT